jgi:hypothetical protein
MDTFFERLLLQVAAIVLQLAILQIVRWVRRPAARGIVVS